MLASDLIKLLEKEIEDHKKVEDQMGPLAVHIDVFRMDKAPSSVRGVVPKYVYAGITDDVKLERSPDGVYLILNSIAET